MGRKRKHVYIDRTQKLASAGREGIKPGISDNVHHAGVDSKTGSFEKRFTHKLCRMDDDYLDAYVMINDIVVLVPRQKFDTANISKVVWSEFDRSMGDMHGKRKKGAPRVKADTCICEVHLKDGLICKLKTPVAGQLIELNDNILSNFEKLANNDSYNGERYVAVIYPYTKLPGPRDTDIDEWKRQQFAASMVPRVCYSYLQGACTRGAACRFQHDDALSEVEGGGGDDGVGDAVSIKESNSHHNDTKEDVA